MDDVVTFVNRLAYSRKLERGWSKQVPDGIYKVASAIVCRRFGNFVDVKFGYGSFMGAAATRQNRYPYLELSPKGPRR